MGWILDDEHDGDIDPDNAAAGNVLAVVEKVDPNKFYPEFNQEQRNKSHGFCKARPADSLVISLLCLDIGVQSNNKLFQVSSDPAQEKAWSEMANGGTYTDRMLEAHSGKLCEMVRNIADDILERPSTWDVLRTSGRTFGNAAPAFSQVATMLCCLEVARPKI